MRSTVVCTAALLALAGCANPILRVDAPGSSLSKSPPVAAEPTTFAEAVQKANHLRAVYYEAVQEQVGTAQTATNGLTWLGTLIAGMAAGNVHRDGILGTALIGGTAYGLTQAQLDGRRLDIWTAGLEALDCAKNASLPFNLGEERLKDLRAAYRRVADARQAVGQAAQAVRDFLASHKGADGSDEALTAATRAEAAADEAQRTQAALSSLLGAARGGELSAAVDRIQTGVTKAIKDTTIGPQAVKQLVGGLGGFAEVLAPGSGIADQLGNAFRRVQTAKASAQSGSLGELDGPLARLKAATDELQAALGDATALLGDVKVDQVATALQACGVSIAASTLKLTPSLLVFTQGSAASKGLVISGGKPPYEVEALDELPDGLSLAFRGGLADRVQVKATAAAPADEYRFVVTDGGATRRSQQFVVQVTADGKGSGGAGDSGNKSLAGPAPADVEAAWKKLEGALTGFSREIRGVKVDVITAKRTAGGLSVKLKCSKSGELKLAEVRDQLAAAVPEARKTLEAAKALDAALSQIDLSASPDCAKP